MYSKTPPIDPIRPSYHVRILSDEQLAQFKSGVFELLEKTGFHMFTSQYEMELNL